MKQNEIRFNNMKIRFETGSWWGNGCYKSIGQILRYIYTYCNMTLAITQLTDLTFQVDLEKLDPDIRILKFEVL